MIYLLNFSYPSFVDSTLQDFCSPVADKKNGIGSGFIHYASSFGTFLSLFHSFFISISMIDSYFI